MSILLFMADYNWTFKFRIRPPNVALFSLTTLPGVANWME